MGATLKNSNDPPNSDEHEANTRHYFNTLVKPNKLLIDEELPDPDTVRNIRAKFQENLNATLDRKLNGKLSGSMNNISYRKPENRHVPRPLSIQCDRDDVMRHINGNLGHTTKRFSGNQMEFSESIKGTK